MQIKGKDAFFGAAGIPDLEAATVETLEANSNPLATAIGEAVSSAESTAVYHSTLFRKFQLSATSTYNFYVDDEDVEPTADASVLLSELPRYVTLRWRTAPESTTRAPTTKGAKSSGFVRPPPAVSLDVAVAAVANGYVSPGVIGALISEPPTQELSTPTKIDEDTFLLSKSAAGKHAASEVGSKSSKFSVAPPKPSKAPTPVNFVDPSIAGAFDKNRIDIATDPLHLTVLGSLAKVMGALEVISEFSQDVSIQNPPPDFAAFPGTPTVMYVGYVIERHDMRPDGSMELGRTIYITDVTQDEFIDQQVSYGGTYLYRIRPIVQWSRTSDIDFAGVSTIERPTAFSALVTPSLASFYAGDWSDWSRTQVLDTVPPAPPDEITVRPVSWKGEIHVAWRVGNDPQQDLSSFKLVRAISEGGRLSDWAELGTFVVANGAYVDRDVRPYEEGSVSYVYAMYSTSFHGVDSPLSDQVEAMLSPLGSREELPVRHVAVAGADRTEHPTGHVNGGSTEVKANRRLTFYCRSTTSSQPLRDSSYLVEVRSLSTGERAIVKLEADAADIGVADA